MPKESKIIILKICDSLIKSNNKKQILIIKKTKNKLTKLNM